MCRLVHVYMGRLRVNVVHVHAGVCGEVGW